ncbi:hypothetical protein F8388_022935 [Cannabis sativa]|uniref:Uncharacterized protein n=1 Tax=Cannabis sativa TaxID=3483 RepID=A0A7J6FHB0_CANSA|nr:hypothetical protein F8388_022935 [Cannabis sativa]
MYTITNNLFTLSIITTTLFFVSSYAATFEVRNDCSYTVWAAASPGGGRRLDRGQTWTFNVAAGTKMARIWGRTNCNFDSSGKFTLFGWCLLPAIAG